MILLNGVPPIIGIGLMHVTFINLLAITIEYFYLKKKLDLSHMLVRVITANLLSLIVGLAVMLTLSNILPGNITRLGMDYYSIEDRLAMVPSLMALVLTNIIIEIPVYLIRQDLKAQKVIKPVVVANLITNIPVVILYGILAI